MTVRVRGIYSTALTAMLEEIVQASPPIQRRFDEEFPLTPARATVETTGDRQGVGVTGEPARVDEIVTQLSDLGRDALAWEGSMPRGAIFAGEVVETLGSGALVDCGGISDTTGDSRGDDGEGPPVPFSGTNTGFLPYSKTARHIDTGDRLRVQVTEPRPPWEDGRPVLETTIRVSGEIATLVRGGQETTGQPELADIVPAEPPDGWAVEWGRDADDADLDALADTIDLLSGRANAIDEAFVDAPAPDERAPHCYWPGDRTCWLWFGRESRFALDAIRRDVVPTMGGHHRIKAGTNKASAGVDFVEAICGDDLGSHDSDLSFPFDVVTSQFGPSEGDSIHIGHGKPDGSYIDLGAGEVTICDPDGQVTVTREMSPGGTYDALGIERQAGDVAITKFKEGRWWYPTVYQSDAGKTRGTYVNICTPVEVFPDVVRYVDLHVDVIKHADGTVERVDDDELDAAVEAGTIPPDLAEKARNVAAAVSNAL